MGGLQEDVIATTDKIRVSRGLAKAAAVSWRFLVVVAAGLVLLYLLVQLRIVVLPLIIASLIATILGPPAAALRKRGVPRILSAWIVLLAFLLGIGGIVWLVAPEVASQMSDIGASVKKGTEDILTWLAEGPLDVSRQEVNDYVNRASEQLGQSSSSLAGGLLSGLIKLGEIVAGILLTIVLLFFFIKDGDKLFDWTIEHLPAKNREDVREVSLKVWTSLGAFVRGTALVALVDGVLIGAVLLLLGVPLVLPLAILQFVGGFFPLVGAVVAGAIAALVTLVTQGVVDAGIVAIAVTAIQQIEGDVLQPVILSRAISIHPIGILLSIAAGTILAGLAGAFLAVPVLATVATILTHMHQNSQGAAATLETGA